MARDQGLNMADVAAFQRKLKEVEVKRVPMAARWALNDVAFEVLAENRKLMQEVFDRPTPFTLNAFYVRKATLTDLTAVVERKRAQAGRHFLEVQSDGGPRKMTGVERLMTQRLKYSGLIAAVLPTKHLKRNQYGNVAPGVLNRIISGVQAQGDSAANTTADSASAPMLQAVGARNTSCRVARANYRPVSMSVRLIVQSRRSWPSVMRLRVTRNAFQWKRVLARWLRAQSKMRSRVAFGGQCRGPDPLHGSFRHNPHRGIFAPRFVGVWRIFRPFVMGLVLGF